MYSFLGESLIFLISQPRAGSTLLQRVLSGHPEIHTGAEPWLMLHPVYALRRTGLQAEYNAQCAYDALQDFLDNCADGQDTYIEAIRALANVLYGRALAGTGKRFFLDKTPRYYYIVPDLHRVFPKARFIFLIRNPLAVLSSVLRTWVKDDWERLCNHRDDLVIAPVRILEGIHALGKEAIVVHYEHLVTAPGQAVRTICRRLEIPFFESMLVYGTTPVPKGRMGDQTGIREHDKPSTASLDKWRELADTPQTRHLAAQYLTELGPQVVGRLGYDIADLLATLGKADHHLSASVMPWHIVTRPRSTWTLAEQLAVERTRLICSRGRARGTALFLYSYWWSVVRVLLGRYRPKGRRT